MQEKKILVIDKDVITRNFLKHTLGEKGYLVLQADTGKEGLILAWRDQPDAIIVDPLLHDLESEVFIQKIRRDARTAFTPVIALSRSGEENFGETYLTQGYSLYFPKSGNAIPQLLSKLEIISQASVVPLKKLKKGKLIVFLSAKGGTGVSSISANVAMNIHEIAGNAKVAIVDMVLPIGSLASLVGYKESVNLTTIADLPVEEITPDFIKSNLPRIHLWKFSLVAGSPNPEAANLLQISTIPHIFESLREGFDYILVDIGRSLSRINLPLIQQANLAVLIVGADKESVNLSKIVTDYLLSMEIDSKKIYPVLNRSVGLDGVTKADSESMLGFEIKMTIPYLGGNFANANNQAEPFTHKFPNDTGAFMLRKLTKEILEAVRKFKN